MRRSFIAYLWDVQDRRQQVLAFVGSQTEEEYLDNRLLRAAVERNLEILGEALVQAKHHFPDQIEAIPDYGKVISFRNELAHCYDTLDHRKIWKVLRESLPALLAEVDLLLTQSPPPNEED